jgi:predicted membrane channel-forming protein YqfA (hemolysin III family)
MFIAMGLSAVFPVFHGMELYGVENLQRMIGLLWLVLQGFLYILGAVIYAVSFFAFLVYFVKGPFFSYIYICLFSLWINS